MQIVLDVTVVTFEVARFYLHFISILMTRVHGCVNITRVLLVM